ncbi:RNA polymerase sigma factor [Acetobacter cibinongensis]|uniref:Uncharacterized protein n=1 Tax=Acetobacter cibinongensis TaxID=146475 RepID=A0A1Z5YRQ0_9PROT|nr:sigma-70 family RNA polymerase sigma factor [Acetobacter cibinongensis]OUI99560.1 hypothetical protein HK14_14305 [Acetobacter cibinongensis]
MPPPSTQQARHKQTDGFGASYGRLLSYARKLTKNEPDAQDLVQEAWCLTDGEVPDSVVSPFSYLRIVIRNLFISNLRRAKRQGGHVPTAGGVDQTLASEQPSPEEVAISRFEIERLEYLISSMPLRQATALKMYHFEDRKLKDIATHLGLSVSFTQALIAKGLKQCAEELDRDSSR